MAMLGNTYKSLFSPEHCNDAYYSLCVEEKQNAGEADETPPHVSWAVPGLVVLAVCVVAALGQGLSGTRRGQ